MYFPQEGSCFFNYILDDSLKYEYLGIDLSGKFRFPYRRCYNIKIESLLENELKT